MSISDWIAVGLFALGLAMTRIGKNKTRGIGFALLALAIIGGAYSYFHAHAEEPKGGGQCNNYGPNGKIDNSCNTTVSPPRDTSGLYQGDLKVGRADGPSIDTARRVASFRAMSFNEYPDPTKPLEFGDQFLSCPNLPQKDPNTFVGGLSAVIAGEQCQIVRRTH